MITVEIDNLIKDLEKYHDDMVFRLEQMVRTFSYNVALTAIQKTPIGDSEYYADWYEKRYNETGLIPIHGLSRGNWQYSKNNAASLQSNYGDNSSSEALKQFKEASVQYRLGDTFYIGDYTPYASWLENNYSPQTNGEGIGRPTMQVVTSLYQFSLPQYYKEAKGAV